jgi:hypothetical protein
MSGDVTYFRIERMVRSGAECFLCALEDEIERKYIDAYLSELVMDAKAREKLVEGGGFCNHHFYRMLAMATRPESSDSHGIALIAQSIIENFVQDLQKQRKRGKEVFRKTIDCPACTHLANLMEIYDRKIVELLCSRNEEFLRLLKNSKGLCIPHFLSLLTTLENTKFDEDIIKIVFEVEKKNFERLKLELSEYVKKQSYEFSNADRKTVEDAPLRSIQKIVGRRGIKILEVHLPNEQK